jgi:hypothetical protein
MNERHDGWRERAASFYGEDIIASQELDANEIAVPISRLCASLGLDVGLQTRRLEGNQLLADGVSHMRVATADGQSLQPCLRADLVPLWLATLSAYDVAPSMRDKFVLYQRECASVLWQSFKPQGFSPEDALLPPTREMSASEQAYQAQMGMAALAREQMMIERQLNNERMDGGTRDRIDPQITQIARAVRVVAHTLAMRSRRNEYGGVFQGLYRQFSIASYRDIPRGRFVEAMEWLDRWRGDIEGEPEPPPDI